MSIVRLGLVEGRHEIISNNGEKVTQFIFPNQINDPNDFTTMERHCFNFIEGVFINERESQGMVLTLEIYVTGLSQALTSTLIAIRKVTEEWLNKRGFKFHSLLMGKPRGGNYHWIDNHLVNATRYNGKFTDLIEKEVKIEVFDDSDN